MIAFVGTSYHGFQIQRNAPTVQEAFQNALRRTLGTLPDIKGCSRTDTGVHANEYCVSFRTASGISPEKLAGALNFHLPKDIRAVRVREAKEGFHARYSCLKKRYRYLVWNARAMNPFYEGRALHFPAPLETPALSEAAGRFLGTRDFAPFSGVRRGEKETVRTLFRLDVAREEDLVSFSAEADGFLYHMARVLAGTLLSVARGKLDADGIERVFQTGIRPNACFTAPAEGLYLDRVFYRPEEFK